MNDLYLIYALSVLDNIRGASQGIAVLLMVGLLFGLVAVKWCNDFEDRDTAKSAGQTYKRWASRAAAAGFALLVLGALIPSRRSVVEAYAMVEGVKIVNADSAEEAAEALGERFDALVDALAEVDDD